MELDEGFQIGHAKLLSFKSQVEACDIALKECENCGGKAEKQVEEHFDKLLNVLAMRKDALLKLIEQKVLRRKRKIEAKKETLNTAIKVVDQILKTGALMFDTNRPVAGSIWKEASNIDNTPSVFEPFRVDLPRELSENIQQCGKVQTFRRFSIADKAVVHAGSTRGFADGKNQNAKFNTPRFLYFNAEDQSLYVCDHGNKMIRKVNLAGETLSFVPWSSSFSPFGIVMDDRNKVFYATDRDAHTIRKITQDGHSIVIAGSKKGYLDGVGSSAQFYSPHGITMDQSSGNLFVTDLYNYKIRKVSSSGLVTTLAGSTQGFVNGIAKEAKFSSLRGICFDQISQSLLVCDYGNNQLRKVQLNGEVSSICDILQPYDVVITANRIILVATEHGTIYHVRRNGEIYIVKKLDIPGLNLFTPRRLAIHEPSHSCFFTDTINHVVGNISFV